VVQAYSCTWLIILLRIVGFRIQDVPVLKFVLFPEEPDNFHLPNLDPDFTVGIFLGWTLIWKPLLQFLKQGRGDTL